jgi:hypothetical protein
MPATLFPNLVQWLEDSPYKMGHHQWLEEQVFSNDSSIEDNYRNGKLALNLYLPIKK